MNDGSGPLPIEAIQRDADYVACADPSVLLIPQYDILPTRKGATLVVNCRWSFPQLEAYFPAELKRTIAEKNIRLLTIDATTASRDAGCTPELLLSTLFWPLCLGTNVDIPDGLRKLVKCDVSALARTAVASTMEYPVSDWAELESAFATTTKRVFGPLQPPRRAMDTTAIDQ